MKSDRALDIPKVVLDDVLSKVQESKICYEPYENVLYVLCSPMSYESKNYRGLWTHTL